MLPQPPLLRLVLLLLLQPAAAQGHRIYFSKRNVSTAAAGHETVAILPALVRPVAQELVGQAEGPDLHDGDSPLRGDLFAIGITR